MTTIKQRTALKKVVENGGNVSKAMREAGYSEATVNNPSTLTRSSGFRELLKASGLDESLVVSSLVEDIQKKPQNRVRELTLGAELLGIRKNSLATEELQQIIHVHSFRDGFGELEKLSNEELRKIADSKLED